jgi:glycosyltransferase involved in cell wall biosynthesis
MRKIEILQICPNYVDLYSEGGGVSNIVRNIVLNLSNKGYHVHLICGNRELGVKKSEPYYKVINDNITVEVIDQFSNPLLGPTKKIKEYLLLKERDNCVAHVHTCFSMFTERSMSLLKSVGIPFIFTPHGKLSENILFRRYYLKLFWWKLFARRVINESELIVLSSINESALFKVLGVNVDFKVIPNGYELPTSNTNLNKPIIDEPYILYLGYLDPRKQPELLLEAFNLSNSKNDYKLVFVGPDEYGIKKNLREKIEKYNLTNKVIFWGSAYGIEKWNILKNATLICLPSLAEGKPVVLSEAVGIGTPVIYSRYCNFPEIQENHAGIMLDDFNINKWVESIDSICHNKELRENMSIKARKLSNEFRWEYITTKWLDIYKDVFSKKTYQ